MRSRCSAPAPAPPRPALPGPPPVSLEAGDQVDRGGHRVHDENPGKQGLLVPRPHVDSVPHGEAYGQIEDGDHGHQGHGQPERGEDQRVPGQRGVVQQVQEVVAETSRCHRGHRDHDHIHSREPENPEPGHGPVRRQPVVSVSVDRNQQQESRRIHSIALRPIHRSVHQLHKTEGSYEPARPDQDGRDASQSVGVHPVERPVARSKDAGRCPDWMEDPA